jgi:hypothetical protein
VLQGISVGVNGGSAPPGVPRSTPFLWRDVASGAQLIAMWHAGGYSGNPVDDAKDCMKVCLCSSFIFLFCSSCEACVGDVWLPAIDMRYSRA